MTRSLRAAVSTSCPPTRATTRSASATTMPTRSVAAPERHGRGRCRAAGHTRRLRGRSTAPRTSRRQPSTRHPPGDNPSFRSASSSRRQRRGTQRADQAAFATCMMIAEPRLLAVAKTLALPIGSGLGSSRVVPPSSRTSTRPVAVATTRDLVFTPLWLDRTCREGKDWIHGGAG